MSSFDFNIDSDTQRRAFRAQVPGLEVWVKELQHSFSIKDISATGFALLAPVFSLSEKSSFSMDLLLNKKLYVADVPCTVIRKLENGIVGCDFGVLDRRQEARLDKLVLEVQKRMIAKKRAVSGNE